MKVLLCTWTVFCAFILNAQPYHGFYDEQTLTKWKGIYDENIKFNFEELIKPNAGCEVRLSLPTLPSSQVDAFNFYSYNNTIILPTSAILFLDQLCIATSWLVANGYSTETVWYYMSMLKHQKFDKYPLPLEALQIPDDALNDSGINQTSQELLKTAIVWLMAHETGHVYFGHRESTVPNEIAADRYANEMCRKIGVIPSGIFTYFYAHSILGLNRSDFSDEREWTSHVARFRTHPLPLDRLHVLALDLQSNAADYSSNVANPAGASKTKQIGMMLEVLVAGLKDPRIQIMIRNASMNADLEDLAPRTSEEQHFVPSVSKNDSGFNGRYQGVFTRYLESGEKEELFVKLDMETRGIEVNGKFNFGLGVAKITGKTIGDGAIEFDWILGDSFGKGRWEKSNSQLLGTWGYNEDIDKGGLWMLHKME